MKFPSHRSLLAGFFLAIALIVGVTWLNMSRESSSQDSADWVAHTHLVRYVIADLFSDLQDVESGTLGFVLTGMPVFLESYHAAASQIEDEIRQVRTLTSTIPEQQKSLDALDLLIKRRLELAAQFVQVRQEQGFDAAQALVAGGQGLAAMEAVRAETGKMDAVEVRLLKERDASNQKKEAAVGRWMLIGACGSLALLSLVFSLLMHENRKRQAAESTLREGEAFLRCVLNSMEATIAVVDRDGTIIATNEAWAVFARENGGDARAAGPGANYLAACERGGGSSEEETRQVLQGVRDVLASSRKTFVCEYSCHSPTEQRWFTMHACPLSRAEGGAVIAHTNITARWLAQESADRLAAIVKSSEDAIIGKDLNGIITSWNEGAKKIFGYAADEIVGTSILRLIPADRHLEEQEILEKIRSGRIVEHFETARQTKDGRLLDVSITASPIKDAKGAVIGASKVARDITAKKREEEELSRKNAELEIFTTAVSHDLKSPLVTIKTFLGYLEKDLGDPVARAKDLGYIHGAADKMKRLLDDLLVLARSGHMRDKPAVFPLQEVVQEALALVAGQITKRGVRVAVTIEPVLLHGDRTRLVEVFQNLLDNAVKFLGDQTDPRIEVGAETEGGEIVLFVRDNGQGIRPLRPAQALRPV